MNNEITGADANPPVEHLVRRQKEGRPDKRERKQNPKKALLEDALEAARVLKRKHRAYYATDPKVFRALVTKAHARVFRLRPGPKADARIAQAARERAQGAEWQALYPKCIDHYTVMPEFTRDLAESGFQRKVSAYLQRHPSLGRRSRHKRGPAKPPE